MCLCVLCVYVWFHIQEEEINKCILQIGNHDECVCIWMKLKTQNGSINENEASCSHIILFIAIDKNYINIYLIFWNLMLTVKPHAIRDV